VVALAKSAGLDAGLHFQSGTAVIALAESAGLDAGLHPETRVPDAAGIHVFRRSFSFSPGAKPETALAMPEGGTTKTADFRGSEARAL